MKLCIGKLTWPELVGKNGDVAAATIKRENPAVTPEITTEVPFLDFTYYNCTRVIVLVDKDRNVLTIPTVG